MRKKPTKEEISERIANSGVDAKTYDEYVNAVTPMEFCCSNGHTWIAKLGNITHNHQGCPYCSGRKSIVGKTDLWTTHPEIATLLLNKQDGYDLTKGSGRKTKFKCPNCNTISEHSVSNVVKRGFSCPCCSDGISYPNKFAASMLCQLGVDFNPEYVFDGSSYRYDFYLNDYNLIIEMHGRQHYEEWSKSERSLKAEQENDKQKMKFALDNNIKHYIVVDARYSDINYISKHILASELNTIFDLSDINWKQCGYYASGSLVHESAMKYNDGKSVSDIASQLKLSKSTIRCFLKKATKIGLCKYVPSKGFLNNEHQVVLLNKKEMFSSISDAAKKYNIPVANISKVCLHERNYAGVDLITGEPYVWRYVEDYDENETIDFKSLINPHVHYYNTKLLEEAI